MSQATQNLGFGRQPVHWPLSSSRRRRPSAADPLQLPVLVLNRIFQPVRITCARRAFSLLYAAVADALSADGELLDFAAWRRLVVRPVVDDGVPIVGGSIRVPRVLHLRRYARCWRPAVRLTRRNVMLRDQFRCQYCARRRSPRELDIDHVLPRSRGGATSWTNLVTACQSCNRRKGRRTPREANMPLLARPEQPRWSHIAQLLAASPGRYQEWQPFIGGERRTAAAGLS